MSNLYTAGRCLIEAGKQWPLEQNTSCDTWLSQKRMLHPKKDFAEPMILKFRQDGIMDVLMFCKEESAIDTRNGNFIISRRWGVTTFSGLLRQKGRGDLHLYMQLEHNMPCALFYDLEYHDSSLSMASFRDLIQEVIHCTKAVLTNVCHGHDNTMFAVHFCTGTKRSAHVHVIYGPCVQDVRQWKTWIHHHILPKLSAKAASIIDTCVYGARLFRMTGQSKCSLKPRTLIECPDPELSCRRTLSLFETFRVSYEVHIHPHAVPDQAFVIRIPEVLNNTNITTQKEVQDVDSLEWNELPSIVLDSILWIRSRDIHVSRVINTVQPGCFLIFVSNTQKAKVCQIAMRLSLIHI